MDAVITAIREGIIVIDDALDKAEVAIPESEYDSSQVVSKLREALYALYDAELEAENASR